MSIGELRGSTLPYLFAFLISTAISFSVEREKQTPAPVTAATPINIIEGQPDGSEIHLKDYSTEELALHTTLDGYTVELRSRPTRFNRIRAASNHPIHETATSHVPLPWLKTCNL